MRSGLGRRYTDLRVSGPSHLRRPSSYIVLPACVAHCWLGLGSRSCQVVRHLGCLPQHPLRHVQGNAFDEVRYDGAVPLKR